MYRLDDFASLPFPMLSPPLLLSLSVGVGRKVLRLDDDWVAEEEVLSLMVLVVLVEDAGVSPLVLVLGGRNTYKLGDD